MNIIADYTSCLLCLLNLPTKFCFALAIANSKREREGFVLAGEEGGGEVRPIPPPFPNPARGRCGKGAGCVRAMMSFQG